MGWENSSKGPTAVCCRHSCCQLFVPGLLRVGHPPPWSERHVCIGMRNCNRGLCKRGWGGTHTLCCLFLVSKSHRKDQTRSLRESLLRTGGLISPREVWWANLPWVAWNSFKSKLLWIAPHIALLLLLIFSVSFMQLIGRVPIWVSPLFPKTVILTWGQREPWWGFWAALGNGMDGASHPRSDNGESVPDIEERVGLGSKKDLCPYPDSVVSVGRPAYLFWTSSLKWK